MKVWRLAASSILALSVLLFWHEPPRATATPQMVTDAAPLLGMGIDSSGDVLSQNIALTRFQQSGAKWTRFALYWSAAEPTAHTFHWTPSDSYLNPVIAAGIKPVVYVARNPTWASAVDCGPIDTNNATLLANFGEFMNALAAHYPQVPVWVLYNEADNALPPVGEDGCFGNHSPDNDYNNNGVPDVQDYAIMAHTAWKAVHRANPGAKVAYSIALDNFDPGTCPFPYHCEGGTFNANFLPDLVSYMHNAPPLPNGEKYADMIAFNYYDIYGSYWESLAGAGYRGIQAKAQYIRSLLQNAGLSMDLFVTETGQNSLQYGDVGQSQCVILQQVRGAAANLQGVNWWTLKDNPDSDPPPRNSWKYGLLKDNLDPKPSFTAYQTLATKLNGYTYDRVLNSKILETYQFVQGKRKLLVTWSKVVQTLSDGAPCAKSLKAQKIQIKKVKRIRVTQMTGASKIIKDNRKGDLNLTAGVIKVKLGATPSIIEINP